MRLEYKWQAAIVTALSMFMAILDNTIVNVALPQMKTFFHTDLSTIEWVVTAYFLAQAAVIPVTGYLSDRIGMKTVFLAALILFTAGSALCAVAPSKDLLIAFRVVQGVGGGALFPMGFAIVFRVFPPAERGPASAVIGVPVLLAPAFGPTIGGYLTQAFDWNAIFTVNIPVGIVALLLGLIILRGRAADQAEGVEFAPPRGHFDIVGLVLAMLGFTALVYGITEAATHGWNDTPFASYAIGSLVIQGTVLRFLILGGVLLAAFVINELLVSDPVLDVRLFLNYTFTITNLLLWGISAFLFGSILLLPIFFETYRTPTLGPLPTGEILISQGVAAAVATPIAGRLYNRIGPRIISVVGFALLAAGSYGLTLFTVDTTGLALQGWLVVRGLGLGFTNIPLQTLVLSVASNKAMARASSLVNVTRQVAGAIGISALTTYLTQQASTHAPAVAAAFQAGPLAGARAACIARFAPNIPAVTACVQQAAQDYIKPHAFVLALNDTFLVVTIATGACALLALVVGRDPAVEAAKRAARHAAAEEAAVPVAGRGAPTQSFIVSE
jgi:EmrB/QacA subfamily drug resistance transporter